MSRTGKKFKQYSAFIFLWILQGMDDGLVAACTFIVHVLLYSICVEFSLQLESIWELSTQNISRFHACIACSHDLWIWRKYFERAYYVSDAFCNCAPNKNAYDRATERFESWRTMHAWDGNTKAKSSCAVRMRNAGSLLESRKQVSHEYDCKRTELRAHAPTQRKVVYDRSFQSMCTFTRSLHDRVWPRVHSFYQRTHNVHSAACVCAPRRFLPFSSLPHRHLLLHTRNSHCTLQ